MNYWRSHTFSLRRRNCVLRRLYFPRETKSFGIDKKYTTAAAASRDGDDDDDADFRHLQFFHTTAFLFVSCDTLLDSGFESFSPAKISLRRNSVRPRVEQRRTQQNGRIVGDLLRFFDNFSPSSSRCCFKLCLFATLLSQLLVLLKMNQSMKTVDIVWASERQRAGRSEKQPFFEFSVGNVTNANGSRFSTVSVSLQIFDVVVVKSAGSECRRENAKELDSPHSCQRFFFSI